MTRRGDQVVRARPKANKVMPGVTQAHGLDHRQWRKLSAQFRYHCAQLRQPCWLCRSAIDYRLRTGPWCFETDHYRPRATHPHLMFVWANLRASHRTCNRARQAKAVEPESDWVQPSW